MSAVYFNDVLAAWEGSGLSAWIELASEEEAFDQMHLLTTVDQQGRNFMLRLVHIPSGGALKHSDTNIESLDMAMILPFQVNETAYDDTARVLAATNLGLLIGALGLVEADGVVMLRHVWHAPADDFNVLRVMPLIDMFGYVAAEVTPLIEQVATGKLRYHQLQQAIQSAVKAKRLPDVDSASIMRV